MTPIERQQQLFSAFAELLAYPVADPAPPPRRCHALLARPRLGRRARLRSPPGPSGPGPHELEELYSSTFDLEPACAPYVGHHLCGDGPQRGVFLSRLTEVYRKDGFAVTAPDGELPDHLAGGAALPRGGGRRAGAARRCSRTRLVPALDKMLASLEDPGNVYRSVLLALRKEVA